MTTDSILQDDGDFNPEIEISFNLSWKGKPSEDEHALGELNWKRKRTTPLRVMETVTNPRQGFAFTVALGDARYTDKKGKAHGLHRVGSNFAAMFLAGVDFDTGTSTDDVIDRYPLARDHASFAYPTASHTPQAPRCRLVFCLETPITTAAQAEELQRALLYHFEMEIPDPSGSDSVRVWYGAPGKHPTWIGGVLDDKTVQTLLEAYRASPGYMRYSSSGPADIAAVERNQKRVEHLLAVTEYHYTRDNYNGGLRYHLKECPFNPEDTPHPADNGAAVIIDPDGKVRALCHHARCKERIRESGKTGWALLKHLTNADSVRTQAKAQTEPPPDDDYMPTFHYEPSPNGATPTAATSNEKPTPPALKLAHFPTHDSGNADAFLTMHPARFAWNDSFGWMCWTGRQWTAGAEGESLARRAMEKTLLHRTGELAGLQGAAAVAPTATRVRNTLAMVQPRVFTSAGTFLDADNRALLNTVSGVVDLRTGALRPATPEDRFLWCVATPYDAQATTEDEIWHAIVTDWVSGDTSMAEYLQVAMGYSITGESREKCLFFLLGAKGNNGKTTFTRAITDTLACSIVRGISLDALTVASRLADPQGFGLAPLIHARYVPASEGDLKGALKGNVLKALTSHGDPVQVAEKGRQPVEWRPTVKLWAMSNHPPRVAGDDPVGWQRFRVIPFDRVYSDTQADPTLGDKLRTPEMRAAILRWLVQGAQRWYAERLPMPEVVKKATRTAALANNSAARYIEECVRTDEGASTPAAELHAAYMTWCEANDIDERDRKNTVHLGRALSEAGYTKDGNRRWRAVHRE